MAGKDEMALMAHLMRRAGFGADREELEQRVAKGYEATLEELLNPPPEDPAGKASVDALLYRYHPGTFLPGGVPTMGQARFMYCMLNSRDPPGGQDGAILASGLCHGPVKSRQLQRDAGPDCHVPPVWDGQL